MEKDTVFKTLNPDQVLAILDEITAADCNFGNFYEKTLKILEKYGISKDDHITHCYHPGDDNPYTEPRFMRLLLTCFICGFIECDECFRNAAPNMSAAIAETSSGDYFKNVLVMPSTTEADKRHITNDFYRDYWKTYRLRDLANKTLNGRLRGNHDIGVFEYCQLTDFDYMVYYTYGGSYTNFEGMDWMVDFYADFEKTAKTDAAVEKICNLMPKAYMRFDKLVGLHSNPQKAREIAEAALKNRQPTMPAEPKFSENVFYDYTKNEFWINLFLGIGGFHKFYRGDNMQGLIYFITGGGLLLFYISDIFKLIDKMNFYKSKREYLEPNK